MSICREMLLFIRLLETTFGPTQAGDIALLTRGSEASLLSDQKSVNQNVFQNTFREND